MMVGDYPAGILMPYSLLVSFQHFSYLVDLGLRYQSNWMNSWMLFFELYFSIGMFSEICSKWKNCFWCNHLQQNSKLGYVQTSSILWHSFKMFILTKTLLTVFIRICCILQACMKQHFNNLVISFVIIRQWVESGLVRLGPTLELSLKKRNTESSTITWQTFSVAA